MDSMIDLEVTVTSFCECTDDSLVIAPNEYRCILQANRFKDSYGQLKGYCFCPTDVSQATFQFPAEGRAQVSHSSPIQIPMPRWLRHTPVYEAYVGKGPIDTLGKFLVDGVVILEEGCEIRNFGKILQPLLLMQVMERSGRFHTNPKDIMTKAK